MSQTRPPVLTRRDALRLGALGGTAALLPGWRQGIDPPSASPVTKPIPSTGEPLAVIGLGTGNSFSRAARDPGQHERLARVLRTFVTAGGALVDTAPNYGLAEPVLGSLLSAHDLRRSVFAATKLADVDGRTEGVEQARASAERLGPGPIDLLQVHNLVDWRTQLPLLRDLQQEGAVRYVGATIYRDDQYEELIRMLRGPMGLDFIQVDYTINNRGAEDRVIPLAADSGTAVIVNMPFAAGRLFGAVEGREIPSWIQDYGAQTWAQFFLRWIISHPSVNVAIPATSNPAHVRENVEAGVGPLPDPSERHEMARRFQEWLDA